MARSLVDKILASIFTEEWKGKYGEKLTERELKWVQLFGRKGKVLRNVYLPKDNGETSEIDVMFITQKGIFVFESKNYSGWIFGDEKSRNWTVMLPNKMKNQFYNPIMQNRTHLKWLGNCVGEEIPLFSIIVFSERCELKKVTVESEDIRVIKRDRTYATVRDYWDKNPDAVTDEQIEALYLKLKELTNVDEAVKAAHVQNIEKKFKKKDKVKVTEEVIESEVLDEAEEKVEVATEDIDAVEIVADLTSDVSEDETRVESIVSEQEESESTEELVCPKCGSKLVLRTAKKGDNIGNQFYGCSGFPKCRYIKK